MDPSTPTLLAILGAVVVLAMTVKDLLERLHLPPLAGYLTLGFALALVDGRWQLLDDHAHWLFRFLAEVGLVCLLFRVGLEISPLKLLRQLPRVVPTWICNVALSAVLGFVASRYVLGLDLVPALVTATALSATSLGVSVGAWDEAGRVESLLGVQLVDVAELDDLSTVAFMVLLFSALPVVAHGGPPLELGQVLGTAAVGLLIKGLLFGAVCLAFARWLEHPLTTFFARFRHGPDPALAVAGVALLIASLAGWLGFSIAIGALFAGLAYSREPELVKLEASFNTVYDLFTPFFFIAIGLHLNPATLLSSLGWGSVLLVAAVLGKVVGAGAPVWIADGPRPALLMGISMVPRAEVALFVTTTVKALYPTAVPDALYGAMVFVSAVTCLIPPVLLRWLLNRWADEPYLALDKEEAG